MITHRFRTNVPRQKGGDEKLTAFLAATADELKVYLGTMLEGDDTETVLFRGEPEKTHLFTAKLNAAGFTNAR